MCILISHSFICLLQWTMSSLRTWTKSNQPLYLQNLAKYLVHIRHSASKCQWMNIQFSQLCSSSSMALLVYYEPRKLCPRLSFFLSLTYSSLSTWPFGHFCAIPPIYFTSHAFWSSGLCPFFWRACSSCFLLSPGKMQPVLPLVAQLKCTASWAQGLL